MKKLSYLDYFLLSLFESSPKKQTSLFHILNGKRTASMLYKTLEYKATPVFGIFPLLDRKTYDEKMSFFVKNNFLDQLDFSGTFTLTAAGVNALEIYYTEHYVPTHLNQLKNGKLVNAFKNKIIFLTQVFSEIRYKNNQYIPIGKNYSLQLWVKNWLNNLSQDRREVAFQFGKEWLSLLQKLDKLSAELLVETMTGHTQVGKTNLQLADQVGKEEIEIQIQILDSFHLVVELIKKNKLKYPIFYSILKEESQTSSNLGESVQVTKYYLEKGNSINEITQIRKLKYGTIAEHMIELAIMTDSNYELDRIPTSVKTNIEQLLIKNETISYSKAKETYPELNFLWYRLLQVKRMKNND